MLTLSTIRSSVNGYDIVILFFMNLAAVETVAYFYGLGQMSTPADLGIAGLLGSYAASEIAKGIVLFLHLGMLSLAALAALRHPLREVPGFGSSMYEAICAAVLAAFINIYVLGRGHSVWENLILAIATALLFFGSRWVLPRSPFRVTIPLAGVVLVFLWLFSLLIVNHHYLTAGEFYPPSELNDFGFLKDMVCIAAILLGLGLIPQLHRMARVIQGIVLTMAGLLMIFALVLEWHFPYSALGRDYAEQLLVRQGISLSETGRLLRSMLWHVILRSYVLLFIGVVMAFAIGFFRRGSRWLSQGQIEPANYA